MKALACVAFALVTAASAGAGAQIVPIPIPVPGPVATSAPPGAPATLGDDDARRVLTASVRVRTRPDVGHAVEGSGVLIASDGLIATSARAVANVGIGCDVTVSDASGASFAATVLEVDAGVDLALLRARELSDREGLRVAPGLAHNAQRVFVVDRRQGDTRRPSLVEGTVRTASLDEVALELGTTDPQAPGGAVVDSAGQIVGLLQRPDPTARAYAEGRSTMRSMLSALRRDVPPQACVLSFGAALPPTWHLGFELATLFTTHDATHPIYMARASAMYFERWYVRMATGYTSLGYLHASIAGGPLLFRTRNDGVVGLGARADGDFGVGDAWGDRREFYGLEVQATGYLAPRLGLSANLSVGLDRRFLFATDATSYGLIVGLGVGLVYRTRPL